MCATLTSGTNLSVSVESDVASTGTFDGVDTSDVKLSNFTLKLMDI